MVGCHDQCNGHELGQTPGDDDGQRGVGRLQSMGWQRVRHDWVAEQHHIRYSTERVVNAMEDSPDRDHIIKAWKDYSTEKCHCYIKRCASHQI